MIHLELKNIGNNKHFGVQTLINRGILQLKLKPSYKVQSFKNNTMFPSKIIYYK